MNNTSAKPFLFLTAIAITVSFLLLPGAQAQEGSKAPVQASKSKTAQAGKGKKSASKKDKRDTAKADDCVENNKHWRDGAHCMTSCNAQGTLCDMHICVKGTWKPYSSCFGPSSVAPNCPASCG